MPTVYVTSLGCRHNQAEMQALERRLSVLGYQPTLAPEDADAIVLNTCAVTWQAEGKSRQLMRRLASATPRTRLVATGCYAERDGSAGGVQVLLVGNEVKPQLIQTPERHLPPAEVCCRRPQKSDCGLARALQPTA